MMHRIPQGMGIVAGLCLAPGAAFAADNLASGLPDATDVVSVRDRPRPDYRPEGVRIGNYLRNYSPLATDR